MFPKLCPPVPPFQSTYPKVWFMQLDAVLAVNGITDQLLMHAILLDALPVELRHLAATSSTSPQPYDALCTAVLARSGNTYRPLPFTRTRQVSPASQSKVRTGPQPSIDRFLGTPASTTSTPDPVAETSTPAPDHDREVEDSPTATDLPFERYIPSEPPCGASSHVPATCTFSTKATARDTVAPPDSMTTSAGPADLPADSPPVPAPVEARGTTRTVDPEPTVTLHAISFPCTPVPAAQGLVDCRRLLTSSSMCPAGVRAPGNARLDVRDAVAMSWGPEGRTPGSPRVEHTVRAPTDAQLGHPPATACACSSISAPSTAHDGCDAACPPLGLASPDVGFGSNSATTHRRTPTRRASSEVGESGLSVPSGPARCHCKPCRTSPVQSAPFQTYLHPVRPTRRPPLPAMCHRKRRYQHGGRTAKVDRTPCRCPHQLQRGGNAGPSELAVLRSCCSSFFEHQCPSARDNRPRRGGPCVFSALGHFSPCCWCSLSTRVSLHHDPRPLLPTACLPGHPRPLRHSQCRPPETHWFPMVTTP
ncbi:hypothetical protein HPB51_005688 [Rhipicephalus microplus]|uniref:DUF7041 domain-containing protein n=1 Tax=Rhipicephalus microplus TaxID=6941 RepID=A0A9J6EXZ1_RHIMP|nr:hypothetical protein HPB51_005688 [Rhipicephalus microplus]